MKTLFCKLIRSLTVGLALTASLVGVGHGAGLMTANSAGLPALEIQSHDVLVTIESGYSVTQVDQVFSNPHGQDLEATYHFPVPDKAAVSEFTVWIDGKPVVGEVLEKKAAQTIYQEEKASGRDTGIAEKNKHYNFEIKVSPVRAGQDTRIRLVYMQYADVDTGIGRYVYPLEDGGTDDQAQAFWTADTKVHKSFSFNLNLRSGYPVAGIRVPAHSAATVTQSSDQEWQVQLGSSPSASMSLTGEEQSVEAASVAVTHVASLDKDIVVYWRLAENLPGSIDLVTHKQAGSNRGTFMMTVTPGDDLAKITEGRDWVFVLDMSVQ